MSAHGKAKSGTITLNRLARMKRDGEKIAVLTAYDASFAGLLESAGVEVILVGDSLGNVVQGRKTTVPVTIDDMVYHTRAVTRGCSRPLVMADLPFMTYATAQQTLDNAARLMREGEAHMVKLEAGMLHLDAIRALVGNGIPVCGHLGLTPQSVHKMGGYRVQGREQAAADRMLEEALEQQAAGIDLLVVECIPSELGRRITDALDIPVIGIGAGPHCDAQVLVLYDMIGVTRGHRPSFSKNFMDGQGQIEDAVRNFVSAVKSGSFPAPEHCF
jgi:3-methyl-2-oxobutanoate hydroxymethyltransferase